MSDVVAFGLIASLIAGLATGLGGIPVLLGRNVSPKTQDLMLGFAAGVMLAASFFSLIIPAIDFSTETLHYKTIVAASIVVAGLLLGAFTIRWLNDHAPHEHFIQGREGGDIASLSRIWLFVIAITLHNFPEGLAVGVGFGNNDIENGIKLATGIGLQNIPEGLAVSLALAGEGYSRRFAFGVALLTGLVEPIGGAIGAAVVSVSIYVLPWALAFAAGAMIFVISHEIIPETHRRGFEREGTFGLLVGLCVMMFLDVVFAEISWFTSLLN